MGNVISCGRAIRMNHDSVHGRTRGACSAFIHTHVRYGTATPPGSPHRPTPPPHRAAPVAVPARSSLETRWWHWQVRRSASGGGARHSDTTGGGAARAGHDTAEASGEAEQAARMAARSSLGRCWSGAAVPCRARVPWCCTVCAQPSWSSLRRVYEYVATVRRPVRGLRVKRPSRARIPITARRT